MIQEDLDALQDRVASLVNLVSGLRQENQQLRQALAQSEGQSRELASRIEDARERVERLLAADPRQVSLITDHPHSAQ